MLIHDARHGVSRLQHVEWDYINFRDLAKTCRLFVILQKWRLITEFFRFTQALFTIIDSLLNHAASAIKTHWGRVTHICVGKLIIIISDNGLSPERRQAIIWTSAGILLIGPLGTNFSEILIEIQTFSLKKIRLKMSSAKCCSFCLGLNVLVLAVCLQRASQESAGSRVTKLRVRKYIGPGDRISTCV